MAGLNGNETCHNCERTELMEEMYLKRDQIIGMLVSVSTSVENRKLDWYCIDCAGFGWEKIPELQESFVHWLDMDKE